MVDGDFQRLCVLGEVFEDGDLSMFRAVQMLRGISAIAHQFNVLAAAVFAT
jgi:hypothetical protein